LIGKREKEKKGKETNIAIAFHVASGDENFKHLSHGREGIPLEDKVPCLLIFDQCVCS
jgi:hypothetical protein